MGVTMNLPRTLCPLVAVTLTVLFCSSVFAQGPSGLTVADSAAAAQTATPAVPDTPAIPDAPAVPDAPAPTPLPAQGPVSQYPTGATSGGWRVGITVYGWFPGLHGTVGVYGHDASIHVPFSDVFDTLKGIIPIAVETDKGRFLMPVDFLWMKLGVNNGIPINDFGQSSIDTHLTQSILTPKFGYRLLDADHLKFDALAGIRYWHLGLNNTLEPSGLSSSNSTNWVDGLAAAGSYCPSAKGPPSRSPVTPAQARPTWTISCWAC
jgi:hypothetical protein